MKDPQWALGHFPCGASAGKSRQGQIITENFSGVRASHVKTSASITKTVTKFNPKRDIRVDVGIRADRPLTEKERRPTTSWHRACPGIMMMTGYPGGAGRLKVGIAMNGTSRAVSPRSTGHPRRFLSAGLRSRPKVSTLKPRCSRQVLAWTHWESGPRISAAVNCPPRPARDTGRSTPYQAYKTQDGYVTVAATVTSCGATFAPWYAAKPEWLTESRVSPRCRCDLKHIDELEKEIENRYFATQAYRALGKKKLGRLPAVSRRSGVHLRSDTRRSAHIKARKNGGRNRSPENRDA